MLQRPHRKLRASAQGMGEEEEGCVEPRAQRDRKQLSFSWQKAKDVPRQHSGGSRETDLPKRRGQGKRKCIVPPRLNSTSYHVRVTDCIFLAMNNLVAENQKATTTSRKFISGSVFDFG